MESRTYHLAQFNVAWLKKPLEHPDIADFKNWIDPIHAIADKTEGFVWRLTADGEDSATSLRPLGEDGIINFTVWKSREALAAFAYRRQHGEALRRRADWFHQPMQPSVAMWWIPSGTTPALEEALIRLQYLRANGPTPIAFTFKDAFEPSDAEAYMQDIRNPPLSEPRISPTQATACIEAYVNAWNEVDPDRRAQMFTQIMTDDTVYCGPDQMVTGRAALTDFVGADQARHGGGRILLTSSVDVHHCTCRFNWQRIKADGSWLPEDIDFAEFAADGRISRVVAFVGPLEPVQSE